jgi:hypothetical protein
VKHLLAAALLALGLIFGAGPSSAVYNEQEQFIYKNVSATQGPFTLRGGQYGVTVLATWGGGSVTLQRLGDDGSTYVTVLTAFSANGYATAYPPSGTYQFAIATATGVYVNITSIVTTM